MNAKDAIKSSINMSSMVLKSYISDLEDADLMRRPGKGCNHLAWQLGHLISSECNLLNMVAPGKAIDLPEGFADAHSKEQCGNDNAADFNDKATYIDLFDKVRAASVAALDEMDDARLDEPAPEAMRQFCPTVGDFYSLIATHPMMHAGQFVIVRRELDKPILM